MHTPGAPLAPGRGRAGLSPATLDVIGARAAGLDAAWIRRSEAQIFDPWGIEPTLIVASLTELAARLAAT